MKRRFRRWRKQKITLRIIVSCFLQRKAAAGRASRGFWPQHAFYYNYINRDIKIKRPHFYGSLVELCCFPDFIQKFIFREFDRAFLPRVAYYYYYQRGYPLKCVDDLGLDFLRERAKYVSGSNCIPMDSAYRLGISAVPCSLIMNGGVVIEIAEIVKQFYRKYYTVWWLARFFIYSWPVWVYRGPLLNEFFVVTRCEFYAAPHHCRDDWMYETYGESYF